MDQSRHWYDTFFGTDYLRFDHHPETRREVRFLRDVLPEDGAVLDLACGSGRHTAPLSRAGYAVIGLDRSPTLIRKARRRRGDFRLIRGDMRAIPLPDGTVDAVTSMFSSVGYFDDEYDNYRVFAEAARVLRPGGRLVIETVNVAFLIRHAPPQTWFTTDGLAVLEEREYDPVTCRSEVGVTVVEGDAQRSYHHSIRLYGAAELAMLLASLGVETLDVFGDFDMSELTVDTPRMILVGERT